MIFDPFFYNQFILLILSKTSEINIVKLINIGRKL